VEVRNSIAHGRILDPAIDLKKISEGLRHFVMMLIWTVNHFPSFSIELPASAISIPEGGLNIRVK
jgi:hypothetical protein